MALSETSRREIRAWVGSYPDDTTLEDLFNSIGDENETALQVLRERLADFMASPVQMGVDGDWRQNHQYNIETLKTQVAQLETIVGVDNPADGITVATMTRTRLDQR